jgi:hypothetical protein
VTSRPLDASERVPAVTCGFGKLVSVTLTHAERADLRGAGWPGRAGAVPGTTMAWRSLPCPGPEREHQHLPRARQRPEIGRLLSRSGIAPAVAVAISEFPGSAQAS